MTITLFEKTYDVDSLNDIERDMYELFDEAAENHPEELLKDATYKITVVLVPADEAS